VRTRIFQLDAFTTKRFAGNPAAVMPLERFPDEELMQTVAAENNLSETAYLVPEGSEYRIRWFTPTAEVPLCGHATLASAAVVLERLERGRPSVTFHSASGPLTVHRVPGGYRMDFPARPAAPTEIPAGMVEALGAKPVAVLANDFNYLLVFEGERVVRQLAPNLTRIAALNRGGVIVTAAAASPYDFVSRYFAPAKGVPEDPVTGSAHCALAPYWAEKLGKTVLRAFQASRRGGEVLSRLSGDRVELEGGCVFYLEGEAEI
jgi:PhzF family phenazine biosynthesis protein